MQNNVVMVGLTVSMHFQQFEELKLLFFSGGACPRTPLNSSRVSNRPDLGGIAGTAEHGTYTVGNTLDSKR